MSFSDELLAEGSDIWEAQYDHPFVTELADGTLDPEAFRHWVEQDYRYLLDYARTFAIAGTKARDEETMAGLLNVAHTVLDYEMDLHREFAADYGISREELESTEKAPTCVAYTNFLVRTAHEGTLPEIAAAIYPCGQGYLDVAEHMAERATEEHRYTPFVEKYTSEEFHEAVDWMRDLVDDCAGRNPGEREAMREAFLTSARLEHAFWEMCYTREGWDA
ncbi:thiaminase II [Salinilacihabitans rarus]|uniref:thiaminase II n=1 Tax=Salinilacihabitans rarus TaxID=2961596 RepID=UPI0020C90B40|nr:thiaminase II [Salinilacihabitans rarus]